MKLSKNKNYTLGSITDSNHKLKKLFFDFPAFRQWQPVFSGDDRARTGDPLLAKQVLSQLSYIPFKVTLAIHFRGQDTVISGQELPDTVAFLRFADYWNSWANLGSNPCPP